MAEKIADPISISRKLLDDLLSHCREMSPEEACGILAGRDGEIKKVYRMKNTEKSQVRYMMDANEQFRVMKDMRQNSLDMVAIYHSHPASPAYPSSTDMSLAVYDDSAYVIISLAADKPDVRAYSIRNQEVREIKYAVT